MSIISAVYVIYASSAANHVICAQKTRFDRLDLASKSLLLSASAAQQPGYLGDPVACLDDCVSLYLGVCGVTPHQLVLLPQMNCFVEYEASQNADPCVMSAVLLSIYCIFVVVVIAGAVRAMEAKAGCIVWCQWPFILDGSFITLVMEQVLLKM
jgi:hypothetical protein